MSRLRPAAWALSIAALAAGAHALWIPVKAVVAQQLLDSAWSRVQSGRSRALPWWWADTWPVARLQAPARGVDQIVLAGATGRTLAFGPGLLLGSAAPGTAGRTVIAGHRDTHFAFLQHLRLGDLLVLETADRRKVDYRVSRMEVVDSRRAGLSPDAEAPLLTLVTCYPFEETGAAGPWRYVVEAEASLRAAW